MSSGAENKYIASPMASTLFSQFRPLVTIYFKTTEGLPADQKRTRLTLGRLGTLTRAFHPWWCIEMNQSAFREKFVSRDITQKKPRKKRQIL
jgi:hypothetical protein